MNLYKIFFPMLLLPLSISCVNYIDMEECVLTDKVKGAWAAKMIGVEYGMPFEFAYCGKTYDGPIEWKPEMVEGSLRQDDIYGQANFMMTFEALGLDAPIDSVAKNFANAAFPLCHSNLQARKNYFDGIPASELSLPENNIHCEDLDFQIEADFIGIVNPAMPKSALDLAMKVGPIMSCADGLYGGIFVAAMDAAAYFATDVESVVYEALKSIPAQSTYAQCICDAIDAYKYNKSDWKTAWQLLEDKWGARDVCTPYIPFNIDAKLNGAYIVLALLYGEGDFGKTMEIAVRCGQDTDCNASSAATVLGIMKGYEAIPDNYKGYIEKIADEKFLFTDYSFKDLVSVSMKFIRENVVRSDGKVEDGFFRIRKQKPVSADYCEAFGTLEFSHVRSVADLNGSENLVDESSAEDSISNNNWCFEGAWEDFSYNDPGDMAPYKVGVRPGAKMTFSFDGSGVAVLGSWNSDCGKAEIRVDGKLLKVVDTYYREEAGKYEGNRAYICHLTGLDRGHHILELTVSEERNLASTGHKVYVEKIIVYR